MVRDRAYPVQIGFLIILLIGLFSTISQAQSTSLDERDTRYEEALKAFWFVEGHNLQENLSLFNELIADYPDFAPAYAYRSSVNRALGNQAASRSDVNRALELAPDDVTVKSWYARHLAAIDETQQALDEATSAINLDLESSLAYYSRARIYRDHLQQPQNAIVDYEQALNLTPVWPAYYTSAGLAYEDTGQYNRALELYSIAINIFPESPEPYLMRGILYQLLGQHGQAIDSFDAALTRGYPPVETYRRRAGAFLDLRQYQSALADINNALDLHPDDARALALRCRILGENRGNVSFYEVLADCERAQAIAPQDANVQFNIGNGYAFLDEYDEAAEAFTRVIELEPNDARAYLNRGRLRLDFLYEPEAALADLNRAIELWPQFYLAYYHRGRAHWQQTNLEQAISDLEDAEPIAGAIGINFYIERARVYYWAGEYRQSLRDYKQILANDPFRSSVHYRVILLQYALRDLEDAASSVEEALQRSEEAGTFDSEGLILSLGGNIALERTEYTDAIDYYGRASDLIQDAVEEVILNLRLRFAELLRGDDSAGVRQRIFSMLATVDSSQTRAWVSHYIALTYLYDLRQTTDPSEQQTLYRDALTELERAGGTGILQIQILRGHLYARLGEADAADAAFTEALRSVNDMNRLIEPDEVALIGMLYTFMAQHEASRGNPELARTHAEQAIDTVPHLPTPYRILYEYYQEQDNLSEAERYQTLHEEVRAACNHCELMALTIH